MKIGETPRVTGPATVKGQTARDAVTTPDRGGRTTRDSASVMGIPSEELTPRVQQAVMTLMGEVDRLKRDLEQSRKRLRDAEDMADQDPLVPALNRRAFERELDRMMSYVKRYGGTATLIYIDLDHFKEINDVHGHAAGDAVLHAVVELLFENTRQSDLVARIGGDEFAVLLMQTPVEVAETKAASLLDLIAALEVSFEGKLLRLSASAGTAALEDGADGATVMARADQSMYEQKGRLQFD
jgi:diguanylate cyclase (GGDEF)-like protein